MESGGFRIEKDCSVCGKVELGMNSFVAASFTKDGLVSLSFFCPKCGSQISMSCRMDSEDIALVTTTVAGKVMHALSASTSSSSDEDETLSAPFDSSAPLQSQDSTPDSTPARNQNRRGLDIRYTALRPGSIFNFDMQINGPQKPRPTKKPKELNDEQKAMIEYFHRQLESLDSVDDAIAEIDSGYDLEDDDTDGED